MQATWAPSAPDVFSSRAEVLGLKSRPGTDTGFYYLQSEVRESQDGGYVY